MGLMSEVDPKGVKRLYEALSGCFMLLLLLVGVLIPFAILGFLSLLNYITENMR